MWLQAGRGNGAREHALSLSPGAASYLVAAAHSPQSGERAPVIWKEGGPRQVPASRAGGLDRIRPSPAPIKLRSWKRMTLFCELPW